MLRNLEPRAAKLTLACRLFRPVHRVSRNKNEFYSLIKIVTTPPGSLITRNKRNNQQHSTQIIFVSCLRQGYKRIYHFFLSWLRTCFVSVYLQPCRTTLPYSFTSLLGFYTLPIQFVHFVKKRDEILCGVDSYRY